MMKNTVTSEQEWTDEALLALPDRKPWELFNGELRQMSPSGEAHRNIIFNIIDNSMK